MKGGIVDDLKAMGSEHPGHLLTHLNHIVGAVGGEDAATINDFIVGYEQGAKYYGTEVRWGCRPCPEVGQGQRLGFTIRETDKYAPLLWKVTGQAPWSSRASTCVLQLSGTWDQTLQSEGVSGLPHELGCQLCSTIGRGHCLRFLPGQNYRCVQ